MQFAAGIVADTEARLESGEQRLSLVAAEGCSVYVLVQVSKAPRSAALDFTSQNKA